MSHNKKMSLIGFWMAAIPVAVVVLVILFAVGQCFVANEAYLWSQGKYSEFWGWIVIPVLGITFVLGFIIHFDAELSGYYD